MSLAVYVADTVSGPAKSEVLVLEDNTCLALHASGGSQALALFPWGTHAVFNRFQVPLLLAEVEALTTSGPASVDQELAVLSTLLRAAVDAHGDHDYYAVFTAD